MKHIFYLVLTSYLFIFSPILAQEWEKINPNFDPPGNYNLYMGTFVNENTGWAVSKCGRIWKTIDSGNNWLMQKDSMGNVFADIDFIDSQCGWLSCYL
ncbi:hypothetical protein K8R42_05205, partial [bacterium]|nr:hypothetical protein [bacterium]